jgi:hypothetical protein
LWTAFAKSASSSAEPGSGQPGSVALVYLGVLVVFFLLSMAVVAITQLLENWAKRRLGQKPVRISTATVAGAAPAGEIV